MWYYITTVRERTKTKTLPQEKENQDKDSLKNQKGITKMANKRNNITVNHEDNTLTVSKTFYKKASIFGSREYYELRAAKQENESYSIEFKTSDKKTYKALTFKRMEDYIKTQPDSETRLMEFEAVKHIAEIKGGKYPLTKKWFLMTYSEYKGNEVSENETSETLADKKAKAQAEAEISAGQQRINMLLFWKTHS